jgi:hypothetical protein
MAFGAVIFNVPKMFGLRVFREVPDKRRYGDGWHLWVIHTTLEIKKEGSDLPADTDASVPWEYALGVRSRLHAIGIALRVEQDRKERAKEKELERKKKKIKQKSQRYWTVQFKYTTRKPSH